MSAGDKVGKGTLSSIPIFNIIYAEIMSLPANQNSEKKFPFQLILSNSVKEMKFK